MNVHLGDAAVNNLKRKGAVVRKTCFTILILLSSSVSLAGVPEPVCVISPDAMPETWRPSGEVQQSLSSDRVWAVSEAEDAEYSIKSGLDEIIDLFARRPSAVPAIWEDSVGALVEVTYSSANNPAIDIAARDAARRNLTMLIAPYLERDPKSATCDEVELLLPLAIYAHKLYPAEDARTGAIVANSNFAFRACGSLQDAMDTDYPEMLEDEDAPTDDVFDLVIWSAPVYRSRVVPGSGITGRIARFFANALEVS